MSKCSACKTEGAVCVCRVCGRAGWCMECAWREEGCVRLPLRVQHDDQDAPVYCPACAKLAEASGDTVFRECRRVRSLREELAAFWGKLWPRIQAAERSAREALARAEDDR